MKLPQNKELKANAYKLAGAMNILKQYSKFRCVSPGMGGNRVVDIEVDSISFT